MDHANRNGSLTAVALLAAIAAAWFATPAHSAQLKAGPDTYREIVKALRPGDTLLLDPGIYTRGLDVHRLVGTQDKPIAIAGASGVLRSVLLARATRNTISIVDSAFVRIADLDVEGGNAAVDAVKAEGTSRFAHDIVIERLRISRFAASQQNVGISTKCPAWNWTIRGNRIEDVGTGLYLGDSDGSAPFVRGVVENNVVTGTRGYSMQVKHQHRWPAAMDGLAGDGVTIIRYNTFAKGERSSGGQLARPNLLLGHWPLSGHGSGERYLVYGNLLLDNPTEALLQAEGNVTLYNNVFVNRLGDGVAIREHNDVPRDVVVVRNTIVAQGTGLLIRHVAMRSRPTVVGNAIFASAVDPPALTGENAFRAYADAGSYLRKFSADAKELDLAPRAGRLADRSRQLESLPDLELDFDRRRRGAATFGAYSGDAPAMAGRFRP